MIILAFKIGLTAIMIAFIAMIFGICINHQRIQKISEYVAKGCLVIAVVTLIPAMLANIWSASCYRLYNS